VQAVGSIVGGAIVGPFLSCCRNDRAFLRRALPRASGIVACILIMAACVAAKTMNAQTGIAVSIPKPSNARYAMHQLTTQAASQLDGTYGKIVQPQVLTPLQYFAEYFYDYNTDTCSFVSAGTLTLITPPTYGTYSSQILNKTYPADGTCPVETYLSSQIDYTWTSTSPLANTDYMVVNYSTPDGEFNVTYGYYLYICPPPTVVTSFNPDLWYAGRNQFVTITGTGFVPLVQANAECPMTTVSATSADNSAVTVTNVDVLSETSIIAYVEPVSTAPTEGATLIVSGAATPSPNADILGTPVISLNGTVISGPNAATPPPVPVVGQQLLLTTTPTAATLAALPIPLGINSSTWTVNGGTNIGGYTPTTASATVTPMPPETTPDLTFDSVYPAASVAETYKLCTGPPTPPTGGGGGGNACNPIASANFAVNGVTSAAINILNELLATIDNLTGCAAITGGPTLVYGNLQGPAGPCGTASGTPGITFYPNGTPPGAGNFLFAQLIDSDTEIKTGAGGAITTCTATAGVDEDYPYQKQVNPQSTSDSPETPLLSNMTKVARLFNATMYLLWQSTSAATSIPVPLGYLPWTFDGTATNSGTALAPVWTASGVGAPVETDGEISIEGLLRSDLAIPDAGFANTAFVPATTITDIPIWSGPAILASSHCVTN